MRPPELLVLTCLVPSVAACGSDFQGPLAGRLLVDVQPSHRDVELGKSGRFTVQVVGNSDRTGGTTVWETSDPAVALVDRTGLVTPRSVGSAVIHATVQGSSDSATLTVMPRAAVRQEWERYAGTSDFRSEAAGDGLTELLGLDGIHVDFEDPPSELTRSLRYDYLAQGADAQHRGVGVPLPDAVPELWAEVGFRLSDNYLPCHPSSPPCDHKFVFLQFARNGDGRVAFHLTGGGQPLKPENELVHHVAIGHGSTQRAGFVGPSLASLKDGEWHHLRLYGRVSSAPGVPDAALRVWIDGELRGEITDGVTNRPGQLIRAILVGRNKDKGRDTGTESVWVGRIRIWTSDPGW